MSRPPRRGVRGPSAAPHARLSPRRWRGSIASAFAKPSRAAFASPGGQARGVPLKCQTAAFFGASAIASSASCDRVGPPPLPRGELGERQHRRQILRIDRARVLVGPPGRLVVPQCAERLAAEHAAAPHGDSGGAASGGKALEHRLVLALASERPGHGERDLRSTRRRAASAFVRASSAAAASPFARYAFPRRVVRRQQLRVLLQRVLQLDDRAGRIVPLVPGDGVVVELRRLCRGCRCRRRRATRARQREGARSASEVRHVMRAQTGSFRADGQ